MLQQRHFLPRWVRSTFTLLNLGDHYPVNENRMDNISQIPTLVDEFNSDDTESNEETPPRNDRHNEFGAGNSEDIRFQAPTHQYNGANSRGSGQSGLKGNNTVQGGTHVTPPNLNTTSQGLSVDAPSQAEYTVGTGQKPPFVEDSKDDKHQQPGRSNRTPSNLGQQIPAVNATNPRTVDRLSFDASGSPGWNSGSRSFHSMENAYDRPRDAVDLTDSHEAHQPVGGTSPEYGHRKRHDPKPHRPESPNLNQSEEKRRTYNNRGRQVDRHHQGIATLFRNFTSKDFTWTLLKDLDDQLVDRDMVQLKFLCKDHVASSHLYQVHRACELFELLQNRALISERRFHMLAELMYRIRRIDLLKKLVTDTKQYQELIKSTPTSLSDYRILLHEICEDTIDDELKMMKFFVGEHFHKPKLTEMKEPQHLFTALEQKDLLGSDNLDLLIKLMEAANKQNMTKKILEFRGSYYPDNPPSLDVFNRQLEVEQMMKPRSYGRQATAQFASGSLGPQIGRQNEDNYTRERLTDHIYDQLHLGGGGEGGDLEDYDRPSMLLSVGVQESSEREELVGELPCYKMNASPRGLCVIFNNKEFYKVPADATSRELKPREGSDIDKGNLDYVFNRLDFKVEMYENVTAKELVNVLHDYAMNRDHSQYDCFTCCILTHGKQDKLYGCDGKLVEIRELTNFFKAAFCPTLRGKPKLFFIQACQGREKQQGYMAQQNPLVRDIQTDDAGQSYEPRDSIPNEADFLLAYATLPGFVSYRSRTHGSWFVNALVENIERYAHKYDLLSIMIKVNEEVAKMTAPMSDGEFKQVPLPHPTLRKRIFFKNNR